MTIGCLPKFSMCESGKIRQWALYACSAAVTTWVVSTLDQPVWVAHDAARVAHGVAEGVGQNLDIVIIEAFFQLEIGTRFAPGAA